MSKIGIIGGSFNPIHLGHLLLAETARTTCELDRVIFIPTGEHPFKEGLEYSSAQDRMEMVRQAIQGNVFFELSDMEIQRKGLTYTIDTIKELQQQFPDSEFYFITGADIMIELSRWHEVKKLVKQLIFITAYRPGIEKELLDDYIVDLEQNYDAKIVKIPITEMNIASSDIRRRVREGQPIKYLVPEAVEKYIYKHRLYESGEEGEMDEKQIMEKLGRVLEPRRLRHTHGVVNSALELWKRYYPGYTDGELKKVRLAALLHDCAKNLDSEMLLEIADKHGLEIDAVSRRSTELLHGPVGALIAEKEFGMKDPDILNAIRYHTTGRINMSDLEKVIFLADYIEPNRVFPGVERLRRTAKENLDEAILAALTNTICFVTQHGGLIHPDSVLTRNAMMLEREG